jgi:antitoxin component YwqK of YwqJK toxin-antitoxin module
MKTLLRWAATAAAAALALPALAIQNCELNGQPVNPNNGYTTEGKTGLMRCRDADSGVLQREQELQNGKFMGVVRYFNTKTGQLEREHSVNERGNRDGVAREWRIDEASGKRVLVREETLTNGRARGVVRTWYPSGQRQRLTFYGDNEGEQASVEFTSDGKLGDLRCTAEPVFGADFDDKAACGHAGGASTVTLYGAKGQPTARVVFERGERRKTETLWESGTVRELRETTPTGSLERRFAADGVKLREVHWLAVGEPAAAAGARPRSVKVLEQEFHTSGTLVHETRWRAGERGAELVTEARWYLNGQLKERSEIVEAGGVRTRRDTSYHDNGKPSFEGSRRLASAGERADLAVGVHKGFDETGRLRSESVYDERGRITRERVFDESGALLRDDEVFEDGSRKSTKR